MYIPVVSTTSVKPSGLGKLHNHLKHMSMSTSMVEYEHGGIDGGICLVMIKCIPALKQ